MPCSFVGKPLVSGFQVSPPSVDLKSPPVWPSSGPPVVQGGRREFHKSCRGFAEFAAPTWTARSPLEGHTGGLFKSTDGGDTWEAARRGLADE